ncbi:MAG: FAD binding domain-containing protein [Deltaproteobacteria bacterium]|nr:FAD binding domain-containing protein [Deltaproteobacteria bacterium]
MEIRFILNGRPQAVETDPDRRVVDLLREGLQCTGTKEGCGSGECGACTILVDGESRLACLMVAAQLEGRQVTTIEGLADGQDLHPLQKAFVECGAVQCGFCTPGMILSAAALLTEKPAPTREEIREGLSGNLCRCTGYQKIVDAVEAAAPLLHQDAAPTPGKPAPGSSGRQGILLPERSAGEGDPARALPGLRTAARSGQPKGGATAGRSVFLPESLAELWSCLDKEPGAAVFAGGTDLFVLLRAGRRTVPALIGLERIAELQAIREEGEFLWIGAGATHGRLLAEARIGETLPVLARALRTLGSPQIRHMGTLGGNLCTASPAGDALPPLYVLDAELVLRSSKGERRLPIKEFITGPGKTRLSEGEILTEVRVRKPAAFNVQHFEKIGQRKALACSVASLSALVRISEAGKIEAVRLAWGSVGETVVTAPLVEALLTGRQSAPGLWTEAAALARQSVSPIEDLRATAAYRRAVSGNLLLRLGASLTSRT